MKTIPNCTSCPLQVMLQHAKTSVEKVRVYEIQMQFRIQLSDTSLSTSALSALTLTLFRYSAA